jgi:polysaccharide biosynthesis protein PslJ
VTGTPRRALLPYGWPLYALFYGFPIWWVLGLAEMVWPIFAFFLLANLIMRRATVRVPRGFGLYLLFLLWMAASGIHVSGLDKWFGFVYRTSLYCSAPIVGLFIFNAPKRLLPNRVVVRMMVVFWVVTVGGGLLGLALPNLQLTTVMAKLVPGRLQANSFVYNLVHPKTAQVQHFLGYPVPRPTAPFVFTNDWGGNFALLVPFVFASWSLAGERLRRRGLDRLVRLLVPLSLFPVVFSLNRTLWASLALIAVYGSTRFGARGRGVAVMQSAAVLVVVAAFLFSFGPTKQLISDRVATPHSNQGRESLYHQSIDLAAQQPLLGYGGPQQSTADTKSSTYKHPDVGTQGQLWTVMVDHGLPATLFFFGYFAFFVLQSRRARSPLALWCHILVLVALFQSPFYGLLAAQLHLMFIAVGLASREVTEPDPPPVPAVGKMRPLAVAAVRTNGWSPPDDGDGARVSGPWPETFR